MNLRKSATLLRIYVITAPSVNLRVRAPVQPVNVTRTREAAHQERAYRPQSAATTGNAVPCAKCRIGCVFPVDSPSRVAHGVLSEPIIGRPVTSSCRPLRCLARMLSAPGMSWPLSSAMGVRALSQAHEPALSVIVRTRSSLR